MSDTHRCTLCARELPRSDFYFRKANGHIIQPCKQCAKTYSRLWGKANPEKLAVLKKSYHNRRGKDLRAGQLRRARAANPEKYKAINQKWFNANRQRIYTANRAGRAVRKAIQEGLLHRPDTCEKCGRTNCKIEASHDDYTKPLEVEWLCVRCHRQKDADDPKTV